MAHGITSSDSFGEVRSRGERAWHGLGLEIPAGLSAVAGFERIGLGWETELCPLYALFDEDGQQVRLPVKEFLAHVRKDNKDVLGVVGEGYQPIGNKELAEFCDALAGLDKAINIETGGSLRGGRRVFACVRLPRDIEVTNKDILQQYVVVSNSHDGSAAFSCYPTSIRVVCANTLRWSERDAGRGVKFRHTGDVRQKIEFARQALGIALGENERFAGMVMALKAVKLTAASTLEFMRTVYTETFGAIDEVSTEEVAVRARARREKIMGEWVKNLSDEAQTLPGIDGSAWAAYNAISQWHDHERGRFGGVDVSDARVHSNLWGVSHLAKKVAWKAALALA